MILVTGGAGFIGTNFVLDWLGGEQDGVINLDKLTYAGDLANLRSLDKDPRYVFVQGDIADFEQVSGLLARYRPTAIVHLAAESHVDRSIHGPEDFVQTNVVGTFRLLEAARAYHAGLNGSAWESFRFLHVSTDEVYGTLGPGDPPFTETTAYAPNSPYSASKAASDHLVRAYSHTYGLPALITNCSNNYGPYQFPEKLIPLVIRNALAGKPLPVYGDGLQVREWLYVKDHCAALRAVLRKGRPGQVYNIGGNAEMTNLEVVRTVCRCLDQQEASADGKPYERLIAHVADRPGHDRRYSIDPTRITTEIGWTPQETFESGIARTVRWYLDNQPWLESVAKGDYRNWMKTNYGDRSKA